MINDMSFLGLRNIYYKYIRANKYPVFRKKEFDKNMLQVKDTHKGETCFIVGNGPSLTADDLDAIAEMKVSSFAANSIFKMFEKTKWRPTYLVFQDQKIIDGLVDMFGELSCGCRKMFVRRDAYLKISKNIRDNGNIIYPKLIMHIRKDRYYDFSENLEKCAFDGTTVTYLMLQLAYYMGFKKICLIGMDHNFPIVFDENDNIVRNDGVKLHCFEDSANITLNPSRVLETTYAYRSARRFLDSRHVAVYNVTRGGKLEEFKRMDMDEMIKNISSSR